MLSEPCSSAVINAKGDLLVSYRHFAWRFSATLSRSSSKAKVTVKSSQPQEKMSLNWSVRPREKAF